MSKGKRKAKQGASETSGKSLRDAQKRPLAAVGPAFKNKEKVLILSSRGVTYRYRHLMLDLQQLIPHSKKDSKLDTKTDRGVINEVCEMKACSTAMFFEVRKHKDLYVWIAKSPDGPTVKFHVANVHTMAELKLTGNHLKGSRGVVSFDAGFDQQPHWQLLKEMLTQAFSVPKGHSKAKPFLDRVMSFSIADGRVWLRNYQVVATPDKKRVGPDSLSLVEVGPRACLQPIKIFSGSFGGATIYENPEYVSPNVVRSEMKRAASGKYRDKVDVREQQKLHKALHVAPKAPFSNEAVFGQRGAEAAASSDGDPSSEEGGASDDSREPESGSEDDSEGGETE